MADFIPEKFYVTRQPRGGSDEVLGFMVPMHKEGFTARKATADRWAGGRSVILPPIEIENKPLSGFSLTENKRRMMNKNVIWRCIHPEGFEFEITSDNFSDFLMEIDMKQGIIQTEMIFIRRSGENYLTWVGSPAHLAAVTQKAIETKVSLKDLQIGDLFTLKTGEQGIYRGAAHTIQYALPTYRYKGPKPVVVPLDMKSSRQQFYQSYDPDTNTVSNQLQSGGLNSIIARSERPTTHTSQTLIDELRADIDSESPKFPFFMVDDKPFKVSDLNVTITELPLYLNAPWSIIYPTRGQYHNDHVRVVLKLKNGKYVEYQTSYKHTYNPSTTIALHCSISTTPVDINGNTIWVPEYSQGNGYWSRSYWTYNKTEISINDVETAYKYTFSRK